jgi:hypothetical protein
MIREFFINLVYRAKKAAHAMKAKFSALSYRFLPSAPREKFLVPAISPETGEAMNMGKCYRRTSDHAPVFSLFTFFPITGKSPLGPLITIVPDRIPSQSPCAGHP